MPLPGSSWPGGPVGLTIAVAIQTPEGQLDGSRPDPARLPHGLQRLPARLPGRLQPRSPPRRRSGGLPGRQSRQPVTEGYICSKVRRFPEHVHGDHRVRYPGFRTGRKGEGQFRRGSWDEALDRIAGRLRALASRGAGEAILPLSYGGSNGYLSQDTTDARLFSRLGASRLARTVCAAPSSSAASGLYGKMAGIAPQDYAHARLIVLWGVNPSVSGIHLVPTSRPPSARAPSSSSSTPGARGWPSTRTCTSRCDPGGDLPLALAVIRWLFENGGADDEFLVAHTTGVATSCAAGWSPGRSNARLRPRGSRPRRSSEFASAVRGIEPRGAAVRMGPRAQPQRRLGGRRGPGASGGGRKIRSAGRRLHDEQLARSGTSTPGRPRRRDRRRRARST